MTLTHFRQPPRILAHHRNQDLAGPYPDRLEALFPRAVTDAAVAEIRQWPGYRPTPLRRLDRLAGALGIRDVLYKDESNRFGLGSFKALGGAYAVIRLLADKLDTGMAEVRTGAASGRAQAITVTTATDGNHGRSIAWGARQAGCRCRIYVPAQLSEGRAQAIADLGAELVRIEGDYDTTVRVCARESSENGWFMVSDTSYQGYVEIPRLVMAGYATLVSEILSETREPITHVVVQAGVGGLAAAVAARFWMETGVGRPRFAVVESEHAACLMRSARRGVPASVRIRHETVMAGMSCGEVSILAWEILKRAASDFVTISDSAVGPALRMLASGDAGGGEIEAGECSTAGVIALIAACCDERRREIMRLGPNANVLVIGTEGATDQAIYRELMAGS